MYPVLFINCIEVSSFNNRINLNTLYFRNYGFEVYPQKNQIIEIPCLILFLLLAYRIETLYKQNYLNITYLSTFSDYLFTIIRLCSLHHYKYSLVLLLLHRYQSLHFFLLFLFFISSSKLFFLLLDFGLPLLLDDAKSGQ